jgi:hypothetical protein
MSRIWDCFHSLCGLIHLLDAESRTASERRSASLQLELLENREAPSANLVAPSSSIPPTSQQSFQAAGISVASLAKPLEQALTNVVRMLPTISYGLNVVSSSISRTVGPRAAQQDAPGLAWAVDTILMNLENATGAALNAAGVSQDPTFSMDVGLINAFMSNPFNYPPPV